MSHANATLTPITPLRLARLVVDGGWTYSAAATMFTVCQRTAKKWAEPYRLEGTAGMADRSSRPHHSPTKTPAAVVRAIVRRWDTGSVRYRLAAGSGCQLSTVHAVLVRCRVNRLCGIDRVTGEPLRRYEHDHPGSLIHVDVTSSPTPPTVAAGATSGDPGPTQQRHCRGRVGGFGMDRKDGERWLAERCAVTVAQSTAVSEVVRYV